MNNKSIRFDRRADKEIKSFPDFVQAEVMALVQQLAEKGTLIVPYGKKLEKKRKRHLFKKYKKQRSDLRITQHE